MRDAGHPIVAFVTAQLDKERRGIRKDMVMSVVNEETQNIVRESLESGVRRDGGSGRQTRTLPPELDDALTQVEAELAKALSTTTATVPKPPAPPEPESMLPGLRPVL